MDIQRLQLDLRPRPNAQALDLGFALLRAQAGQVYLAWLAVWLPVLGLCALLAYNFGGGSAWTALAWWLRPLLERAPLYVLSRGVFGERVTWQQALRAWPSQLGGGWFRVLTWWRLFMPGRGVYQPIWVLEGARGKVAAERRRVIGDSNTGASATWFGVACAHLEMVVQLGTLALLGFFLQEENLLNPFAYVLGEAANTGAALWAPAVAFGVASAMVAPIYTACCFTLYLNRRATLEAWDIELTLRQIQPLARHANTTGAGASAFGLLATAALAAALSLGWAEPALAAAPAEHTPATSAKTHTECERPSYLVTQEKADQAARGTDKTAEQAKLRSEIQTLYAQEDLRGYKCQRVRWFKQSDSKKKAESTKEKSDSKRGLNADTVAAVLRYVLIAAAVLLVGWLLLRHRHNLFAWRGKAAPRAATEVAGLDIRPQSLPDDVSAAVWRTWQQGQQREALSLLYRATLSRLVNQDGLVLTQGATEGDCWRRAQLANLRPEKTELVGQVTQLWLNAAYGDRWPMDTTVQSACAQWTRVFEVAAGVALPANAGALGAAPRGAL